MIYILYIIYISNYPRKYYLGNRERFNIINNNSDEFYKSSKS